MRVTKDNFNIISNRYGVFNEGGHKVFKYFYDLDFDSKPDKDAF